MGQLAFEILLDLMRGDTTERIVVVQGELIVRESTGAPRRP
jgi:DNA-binding LacI/PurR family transcriptional regulator